MPSPFQAQDNTTKLNEGWSLSLSLSLLHTHTHTYIPSFTHSSHIIHVGLATTQTPNAGFRQEPGNSSCWQGTTVRDGDGVLKSWCQNNEGYWPLFWPCRRHVWSFSMSEQMELGHSKPSISTHTTSFHTTVPCAWVHEMFCLQSHERTPPPPATTWYEKRIGENFK